MLSTAMGPCVWGSIFFLVISLPSGNCFYGNDGIKIRTCTALDGLCFFGCKSGWTWVAFCHNMMSCCIKQTKFIPPQANRR
ncbi:beta-defensin 136 [Dipodomys spectabilis]|uniref:beta-defensin 136 n=1 Tax=Dipodomys spectabilis TaxID=105255 RepID=UPI001C545EFA|nr:beta-defensin 136 [Dipodomys spectabilis]